MYIPETIKSKEIPMAKATGKTPDVPTPAGPLYGAASRMKPNMPKPPPVIRKVNHKRDPGSESDIIKHQNKLNDYFHWYEAGIGFAFGSMFFSFCYFIWG